MALVIRTSVEIPFEIFKRAQLLVANGEFSNFKELVCKGLELILKQYDEAYFVKLEQEYSDVVEKLNNSKCKIKRIRSRRVFL